MVPAPETITRTITCRVRQATSGLWGKRKSLKGTDREGFEPSKRF
jgi:hypothetical protein